MNDVDKRLNQPPRDHEARTRSVWMSDSMAATFPALSSDRRADVVVVGGGITGLSIAARLHERGLDVVVLEMAQVGRGNTGRSTGNLYATLSTGLHELRDKWSDEVMRDVVAQRSAAVTWIEQTAATLGIDCDFRREPLHTGVENAEERQIERLEAEFTALEVAGLAPQWVSAIPGGPSVHRALRIEGQAQCNPWLYAQGLAHALAKRGVALHENSPVIDIDAGTGVQTPAGSVKAKYIVMATHTPVGFNLVQAEMRPCTEYGIALESGNGPDGICWIRYKNRSIRRYQRDGKDYLVVVGDTHATGTPVPDPYAALRDYAHRHWQAGKCVEAWSAHQLKSADGLPYIGRSAHDNVLIATGFAADGLTWGTVAASVISALVSGQEDAATRLLTPRRFTATKSATEWAKDTASMVRHFVGDRLAPADVEALSEVPQGEGRLVELEDRKYAVYRAPDGTLNVLSPFCTHLRCLVAWNTHARSWDCPCHGSRFHPDGRVMDGPAPRDLERYPIEPRNPTS